MVNSAIQKGATSFAFRPTGCSGVACTSVRAVVISTGDSDPIADGATLYTCRVNIAANASLGQYPLVVGNVVMSDSSGSALPSAGRDGMILVTAVAPTATPTPVSSRVSFVLGSATGIPNEQVTLSVSLDSESILVAAAQVDLAFDPRTYADALPDGHPDCAVNASIDKSGSSFSFLPTNCQPGVDCAGLRAVVIAFDNTTPIPSGAVLFTCNATIGRTAEPGTYGLTCSHAEASDPQANPVPATCTPGMIEVGKACSGDCNGDHQVTVDEVLTGVNILLGNEARERCPAFDTNVDQQIAVNELLQGVIELLDGCPAM